MTTSARLLGLITAAVHDACGDGVRERDQARL